MVCAKIAKPSKCFFSYSLFGRCHLHRGGAHLFANNTFSSLSPFVWAARFHRHVALSVHADRTLKTIAPRGRECSRTLETVMAKDFSRSFYDSPAWRRTRNAYIKQRRGLCEDCLARGIIKPAEIVHHIIELTPDNITDPHVALSFDNLRCVCRECHAVEHGAYQRRYEIRPDGSVLTVR